LTCTDIITNQLLIMTADDIAFAILGAVTSDTSRQRLPWFSRVNKQAVYPDVPFLKRIWNFHWLSYVMPHNSSDFLHKITIPFWNYDDLQGLTRPSEQWNNIRYVHQTVLNAKKQNEETKNLIVGISFVQIAESLCCPRSPGISASCFEGGPNSLKIRRWSWWTQVRDRWRTPGWMAKRIAQFYLTFYHEWYVDQIYAEVPILMVSNSLNLAMITQFFDEMIAVKMPSY
jgi:hypothetical protein